MFLRAQLAFGKGGRSCLPSGMTSKAPPATARGGVFECLWGSCCDVMAALTYYFVKRILTSNNQLAVIHVEALCSSRSKDGTSYSQFFFVVLNHSEKYSFAPEEDTQWIGRGGPIAWPARSPDLTPLDYFLWNHMNGVVYETPVESEEDLLARIMAAEELGLPGIGDRVYRNMVRRYHVCVDLAGRHIEPVL
ncbi:hypothetical protein PR048_032233 [Dryococelus australis]|uniref:Uncharacterized protein n=1 Tax=Dryococelus australis TaxID=614101 RepID=A0ABQ9G1P4_9NEOP|nr:hypothetical protein PR048_032233 [Dryococelus australis]